VEWGSHNSKVQLAIEEREKAGWEWLKSHRVWAADRKEYLYPENWLEPES
jgi:hypothetical protein